MNMENFKKFLASVNEDIEKIFNHQREFISCKEGCSLCCERGDYPISEIEYKYMMIAYEKLDENTKSIIKKNVQELKNSNKESYTCPFLIEHRCSIYSHRPFVSRTFGVLTEDSKGNPCYPFCATLGKNYSEFYDAENNRLSSSAYYKKNYLSYPKFFRLSNKVIMNLPLAEELKINFGEAKKMIDYLELE